MRFVVPLLGSLRKNRKRLMAFFLLFLAASVGVSFVRKPAFETTAKLLINLQGRGVSLSRAEVPIGEAHMMAAEAINTQVEVLRSRVLIEEAIARIGPEAFESPLSKYLILRLISSLTKGIIGVVERLLQRLMLVDVVSPQHRLIEQIERNLVVYPVRQSAIIAVTFRWHTLDAPQAFLRTLLDLYFTRSGAHASSGDEQSLFSEQADRARAEMDKGEGELRDLRIRMGITDLPREKQLLVERIERITSRVALTKVESPPGLRAATPAANGGRDDILIETADGDVAAGVVGYEIPALRSRLNALMLERSRLQVVFTEREQSVRQVNQQIATLTALLNAEGRALADMLDSARRRLKLLLEVEGEFSRLNRNVDVASEAYQVYRKVASDRRVARAQEARVKVQIVDAPTQPFRPIGMNRLVRLLLGLVLSIIATLALALAMEYWERFGSQWLEQMREPS